MIIYVNGRKNTHLGVRTLCLNLGIATCITLNILLHLESVPVKLVKVDEM